MSGPLKFALARALDAVDLCFDGVQALWRVIARGAFAPDSKSYRGAHFETLAEADVLVQSVEINAEDIDQARKIVALDPLRYLPLAMDAACFDMAGPVDAPGAMRTRPERRYLAALARHETLAGRRLNKRGFWRTQTEAFSFASRDHAHVRFVFHDQIGRSLRRRRRALLAFAFAVFAWAGFDAASAWREQLDARVIEAEQERATIERAIRLAERAAAASASARAAVETNAGEELGVLDARLAQIALRLPPDSELTRIGWSQHRLTLQGRSFQPQGFELELRRAFETAAIGFSSGDQGPPPAFDASLTWPAQPVGAP